MKDQADVFKGTREGQDIPALCKMCFLFHHHVQLHSSAYFSRKEKSPKVLHLVQLSKSLCKQHATLGRSFCDVTTGTKSALILPPSYRAIRFLWCFLTSWHLGRLSKLKLEQKKNTLSTKKIKTVHPPPSSRRLFHALRSHWPPFGHGFGLQNSPGPIRAHFERDFGNIPERFPYWCNCVTQLLEICQKQIFDSNLCFHSPRPKGAELDLDLVTVAAIGVQWTHCHVCHIVTWCVCVVVASSTPVDCRFECCWTCSVGRGNTPINPNHWSTAGRIHAVIFWLYLPNIAAKTKTHQHISNILLSKFGEPVLTVASVWLSWPERHLVWSAASVVANFLQGLQRFPRDKSWLQQPVIISNQSVHSSLTPNINKAFPDHSLQTPEMVACQNPRRSAVSETRWPVC